MAVNPIPDGFGTVTPYLIIKDAAKAIDFYKKAFGAEEMMRQNMPDGQIMHASLKIGDSMIMLNDEFPDWGCVGPDTRGGTSVSLHIYVADVDAAFRKAIDAGASELMPVSDTFWGARFGKLKDPFGHEWSIATHTQDLTPEQVAKGAEEFFATCAPPSA